MKNYRLLNEGEVIKNGDEWHDGTTREWIRYSESCIGHRPSDGEAVRRLSPDPTDEQAWYEFRTARNTIELADRCKNQGEVEKMCFLAGIEHERGRK